jgi:hypothetical protein
MCSTNGGTLAEREKATMFIYPASSTPSGPAPLFARITIDPIGYRPDINLNVLVDNRSSWKCVVVQHVAKHYIDTPTTVPLTVS